MHNKFYNRRKSLPEFWPTVVNSKGEHAKPLLHIALMVKCAKEKNRDRHIARIRSLIWSLDHWYEDSTEWGAACKKVVEQALLSADDESFQEAARLQLEWNRNRGEAMESRKAGRDR